jgi:glycosyltransferase involved in cell wall biosynthesis
MQIGFDAKRLFQNKTGLGNYSRTLVSNLHQYAPKYHSFLYTPSPKTTYPYFLHEKAFSTITPEQNPALLWRSFGIKKQLQNSSIDIFHGLSNELPIGIHHIKKLKSVVTIHDLIFKKLPKTYPFIDRTLYNWKVQQAVKSADKIIAISQNTKNDLLTYYPIEPSKIEVLYQACHPIFYQKDLPSDSSFWRHVEHVEHLLNLPQNFILVVGGLGQRKNLLQVIKAQQLLPKSLRIPIVLVGKGKPNIELNPHLQKALLSKDLIWLKNIDSMLSLKQLYQKATVVVYPSLYEGFGLPIVEALLCKTPVITASNSSLPEAGGSAAWYATHVEQLALTIEEILIHEEATQQRIATGYSYAWEQFHPQKLTAQLIALYQSIL